MRKIHFEEVWLVSNKRPGLYRTTPGHMEYISITEPVVRDFICIHKDVLKKEIKVD